nr:unnamed protein product [Spirometra erinaceieuropaei]
MGARRRKKDDVNEGHTVSQKCSIMEKAAARGQRIPYKQSYEWLLDVHKSRARARFPWIPREPPTICSVGHVQRKLPEMRADLVVPADLDSCELKPYVAWRANVVDEPPVNSESLFKIRYAEEIKRLHDEGVNKADILKKI